MDRLWKEGKLNTLWAGAAVLLCAAWEVWGSGGFKIPQDKAALGGLLIAALRLAWAKDHPGTIDPGAVSGSWKPKPETLSPKEGAEDDGNKLV